MNKLILMLLAGAFSGAALAAAHTAAPMTPDAGRVPDPKQTAQCNSQAAAKNLKGDERKAYLTTCMGGVANSTASPQSMTGAGKPALETSKP